MNLINDAWIPAIRADGSNSKIAPWQIVEIDNPVVELAATRPDFQGALYQFLIGLMQTTFAPEDTDEWQACWQVSPEPEVLKVVFSAFSSAFELDSPDGPAFLQDYDLCDGESKPVEGLLIESPGGKTRKDNLDHFIKGGNVEQACLPCAAAALMALQANAPAGGVGHRVGLRGGGPLTTLVLPESANTLWKKLWANMLTEDEFEEKLTVPDCAVFPWMAVTRYSDKSGQTTYPEDVHLLQQYWGMPRRIRLDIQTGNTCQCSLCGEPVDIFVTSFRTKNYGVDYDGPWLHPLTPYRFDPKKKNIPLSLKGQQGGLGYRHWLGLVWQDESSGDQAAAVVRAFNEERNTLLGDSEHARLWCFGYDMDNMKARCWYEHTMPLMSIAPSLQKVFFASIMRLLAVAKEAASLLRSQVKAGWFKRPADAKGDMSGVVYSFWQQTEKDFYRQLHSLSKLPSDSRQMSAAIARQWLKTVQSTSLMLFDQWVMEGSVADMNMKRVIEARNDLEKKLSVLKPFKELRQIAQS